MKRPFPINRIQITAAAALLLLGCGGHDNSQQSLQSPDPKEVEVRLSPSLCKRINVSKPEGATYLDKMTSIKQALAACNQIADKNPSSRQDEALTEKITALNSLAMQYQALSEVESYISHKNFTAASRKLDESRELLGEKVHISLSKQIQVKKDADALEKWQATFPGFSKYAKSLHDKYHDRAIFKTADSKRIIESFNIQCNSKDGRYLPLINIIYAKIASMDNKTTYLGMIADSRGEEIRIYDVLVSKTSGKIISQSLAYEIDKWNELRIIGTTVDAHLSACFSGWGEIWAFPKSVEHVNASTTD